MKKEELNILEEFLQSLYLEKDNICVTLLKKKGGAETAFLNSEKALKKITEYDSKKVGAVCITPNPIKKGAKRSIENVEHLNALFVDIDGTTLNLDGIQKPHYVFQRGKNHFHIYWFLKRIPNTEKNRNYYTKIAEALIEKLGGDPVVKDVSRVLRLPYTYYEKDKKGGYTLLEKNEGPRYDLKSFKEKKEAKEPKASDADIETFLLNNKPRISRGQGRSRFLYYFGLDCFSWGVEKERALELSYLFNSKHCIPPEPDRIVKHQIESSYRYARGTFGEFREKSDKDGATKALAAFKEDQDTRNKLEPWVYIIESDRFVNISNGMELTTSGQVDTFLSHLTGRGTTLKHILRKELVKVVDKMDFRPDNPRRFYRIKKIVYLNRFAGFKPIAKKKNDIAVELFLNHIELLTTSEIEAEHFLDYLSFLIQKPGKKISHSVLLISKYEGLGKSLLEMLLRNMLQSPRNEHYVSHVENAQIMSDYTDFMANKLVCFVHELAQGDRYSTMNRLKSLITEDTVSINAKYARQYYIKNTVNFVFFSNLIDAIKIGKHDRRLFVVYNDKQPKDPSYYKKIASTFENEYEAIYHYLHKRNIKKFNPHERPPTTKGKEQLSEQSLNELSLYLQEILENRTGPFENNILLLPELLAYCQDMGPNVVKNKASYKSIRNWLIENDYDSKEVDKKIKGKRYKHRIYYKKDYIVKDSDLLEVLDGMLTNVG